MKKLLLLLALITTATAWGITLDVDTLRSPDHTKVWTPPSSTATLVGRDTSEALSNKSIDKLVATSEEVNSTVTGSNAVMATPSSLIVQVTDVGLVSIDGITAPASNMVFILKNKAGAIITLNDETGVNTTFRIKTGTAANLSLAADASAILAYSTTDSRWQVVGGSGSGGGLSAWITATSYVIGDIVIESNKIYKCLVDHPSTVFATDLAANDWIELSAMSGVDLTTDQTIGGNKTFSNTIVGSINGNAATVTNGVYTTDKLSALSATTSAELAGVISDETGTGKVVLDTSPTLVTPNIGTPSAATLTNATGLPLTTGVTDVLGTSNGGTGLSTVGTETKNLKVVGGALTYAEEDRANFLLNPNFEWSTLSDWACTVGSCTSTNSSGEYSEGLRAMKVALSTEAMNVSQSVSTLAGATKQYAIGVSYRVPSAMADFQICTLIAGSEKTCVPSANLILDDAYHTIEIPEVITPGSTVGIKFKTTSSYTANAFFDMAYIKQGIGTQNLALDDVYSAKISSTGVVSGENTNWISGNCTNASPTVCTIETGIFSTPPNCTMTPVSNTANMGQLTVISATSFNTQFNLNAKYEMHVICQKSGNDYLAASASVYSQSSANYSSQSCGLTTSDFVGMGTVSNINFQCARDGENLIIEGRFTAGTSTATEARINLGGGLTSAAVPAIRRAGSFNRHVASSASSIGNVLIEPSVGYMTFSGFLVSASDGITKQNGSVSFPDAQAYSVSAVIPISGWSNSSSIVGTFFGTPKVPGLDGNVDTFSVSYGTTNATTVCSASPCSYLDQIGTAVTSVTRSATGTYALNTAKTYSKVKCQLMSKGSAYQSGDPIRCEDCNSVDIVTVQVGVSPQDSYGTISCIGSY